MLNLNIQYIPGTTKQEPEWGEPKELCIYNHQVTYVTNNDIWVGELNKFIYKNKLGKSNILVMNELIYNGFVFSHYLYNYELNKFLNFKIIVDNNLENNKILLNSGTTTNAEINILFENEEENKIYSEFYRTNSIGLEFKKLKNIKKHKLVETLMAPIKFKGWETLITIGLGDNSEKIYVNDSFQDKRSINKFLSDNLGHLNEEYNSCKIIKFITKKDLKIKKEIKKEIKLLKNKLKTI